MRRRWSAAPVRQRLPQQPASAAGTENEPRRERLCAAQALGGRIRVAASSGRIRQAESQSASPPHGRRAANAYWQNACPLEINAGGRAGSTTSTPRHRCASTIWHLPLPPKSRGASEFPGACRQSSSASTSVGQRASQAGGQSGASRRVGRVHSSRLALSHRAHGAMSDWRLRRLQLAGQEASEGIQFGKDWG